MTNKAKKKIAKRPFSRTNIEMRIRSDFLRDRDNTNNFLLIMRYFWPFNSVRRSQVDPGAVTFYGDAILSPAVAREDIVSILCLAVWESGFFTSPEDLPKSLVIDVSTPGRDDKLTVTKFFISDYTHIAESHGIMFLGLCEKIQQDNEAKRDEDEEEEEEAKAESGHQSDN